MRCNGNDWEDVALCVFCFVSALCERGVRSAGIARRGRQPSAYHLGVPSTFTRWEVCWNCSAWALSSRRLLSEVSAMGQAAGRRYFHTQLNH